MAHCATVAHNFGRVAHAARGEQGRGERAVGQAMDDIDRLVAPDGPIEANRRSFKPMFERMFDIGNFIILTVLHGETAWLNGDMELKAGSLQRLNEVSFDAVVTKASY